MNMRLAWCAPVLLPRTETWWVLLKLMLSTILVDFLAMGCLVATIGWLVCVCVCVCEALECRGNACTHTKPSYIQQVTHNTHSLTHSLTFTLAHSRSFSLTPPLNHPCAPTSNVPLVRCVSGGWPIGTCWFVVFSMNSNA
jgi:hypothetical protein